MKNMFYFMHVPWNWIKQRPHFLAEELSKDFDLVVLQEKVYNHKRLTENKTSLRIKNLFRLPFARIPYIQRINSFFIKLQLKSKIKKVKHIWLTSPIQYQAIYSVIDTAKIIIYDCMDDLLAFPSCKENERLSKVMAHYERLLIQRANVVFCSSAYLRNVLINRYNIKPTEKLMVVNNAITIYENDIEAPENIKKEFIKHPYNLCYIGTISQWFDFPLIIEALNKHSNLFLFLFGPSEIIIPPHKQIVHFGPIEHKFVYPILKNAGLLIMPFIINDLILSVNPVKLYEYIYCQKLSLAKNYPEVHKFEEYVYLYNTKEDFFDLIDLYCKNNLYLKKDETSYKIYGINNTWTARAKHIKEIIDNIT